VFSNAVGPARALVEASRRFFVRARRGGAGRGGDGIGGKETNGLSLKG